MKIDWDQMFSKKTKDKNASPLSNYMNNPNIISLAGGFPNPENFPFQEIITKVKENNPVIVNNKKNRYNEILLDDAL